MTHSVSGAERVVLVWVSSPDGRDHLVTDAVLATSRDGRFSARCGELVLSASLGANPGHRCALCAQRPDAQRREGAADRRLTAVVTAWLARPRLHGVLTRPRPSALGT